MAARVVLSGCVLFLCSGLASLGADETPLDRLELDKRLARIVHDASLRGANLWEDKNFEGTYRLYEGTLRAVEPLLDHHPKLAEMAVQQLDEAEKMDHIRGAVALRKALDAIQKETAKALTPKTTWDRLRGEAGVRAIVKDFLLAVATDPKMNATRGGTITFDAKKLSDLEQYLVEWISQQMEGPLKYTGPDVRKAFAGLNVSGEEFDAAVGHLEAVLKKYQIPAEESKKLLTAVNRQKTAIVKP
jgi:truncated hemoglobin YjbI